MYCIIDKTYKLNWTKYIIKERPDYMLLKYSRKIQVKESEMFFTKKEKCTTIFI